MIGLVLLIPFLGIRFVFVKKSTLKRAAHFAPLNQNELPAYWFYQISTVLLLVVPLVSTIDFKQGWALGLMAVGLGLLWKAMHDFARPNALGFSVTGSYRYSRNPIYLAYFLYFIGLAMLLQSPFYYGILMLFLVSSHVIIRAEERWCQGQFGAEYQEYIESVRRYL